MAICHTSLCTYLMTVRGLSSRELDRGAPYSDLMGATPVLKATGVGENDGTISSQETNRAAIAIAEQDFVKTAWKWFSSGPSRGIFANTTTQTLRTYGISIDWLPDGGRLLYQTLREIDHLKNDYLARGMVQDSPSYREAMTCGIMKFHQHLGISFRNIPGKPVSVTQIHLGQKLECQSYAGLYYSAALLAGLSPHWMEAIWPDAENTHLYIAVPVQDQVGAAMVYVDLMTNTCSQDNPFPEATTRELTSLEVMAGYAVARGGEKELEKARQLAPQDYEAQYTSAIWYITHYNVPLGRKYLERAVQLFPAIPRGNDVRAVLSVLSQN